MGCIAKGWGRVGGSWEGGNRWNGGMRLTRILVGDFRGHLVCVNVDKVQHERVYSRGEAGIIHSKAEQTRLQ